VSSEKSNISDTFCLNLTAKSGSRLMFGVASAYLPEGNAQSRGSKGGIIALNGPPQLKFTEIISFAVNCRAQAEVGTFYIAPAWETHSRACIENAKLLKQIRPHPIFPFSGESPWEFL
jgi:hypothetical protein